MKATIRSAKMDKDGKHNDRNFEIEEGGHIDRERLYLNKYYTYNGNTEMTFLEIEKEFYREHFSEYLEAQNERHRIGGHKKRMQTLDDYFANKKTRPEDVILQIGDMNEHATGDELWECAMKYKDKFEDAFGEHCAIIDMALHMDEETPHVHIRRVWIAEDDYGMECVNLNKSLKELDLLLPDGSQPEDRYNNRKISFSHIERDMFIKICEDEGFEIDRVPTRSGNERVKHLSPSELRKIQEAQIDFSELKRTMDEILNLIMQDVRLREKYKKELEDFESKKLSEQVQIAREISKEISEEIAPKTNAIDKKLEDVLLANENRNLREFLNEKGLLDEYENRKKSHKKSAEKEDVSRSQNNVPTESYF